MDSKDFKTLFDEIAKTYDFKKAFGGWYKDSSECLAILDLQKSNFSDYYQLNIKIFIQGVFEKTYLPSKDLIKKSMGHVNSGETKDYKDVFDFDKPMKDEIRKERLKELFTKHIVPFTNEALSRAGIRRLAEKGDIFLLSTVREELS
ncbi:DUF4304 domain-containing protein [Capnocytophaga cynodegmi]|uniref:DUF4304 domain-containing protein n=1 Tax=Capnocytophaga cynodegmi TaxID=28189 RepID=UPI00385FAE22